MAELNKLVLPVKNTSTGVITNQEFDIAGSGGGSNTNFVGTTAEWNALTSSQKAQYTTVDLTDNFDGYTIDNVPTANSDHLVKSGGVYSAIQSAAVTVSVGSSGTASDTNYSYQYISVNGTPTAILGSKYMETSEYTTADGLDTFEFTNSDIATSSIDGPFCDIPLVSPVSIVKSGSTLSVSFNSTDGVGTCGIYLK